MNSYNTKPNLGKLKTMHDFEGRICGECGGVKFKRYSELDYEQRLIAKRMATKSVTLSDAEKHLVCARCFTMLQEGEKRA